VPCGALFEDDLVGRGAVVVVVEIELGAAASGQLDRQPQHSVFLAVQFGQSLDDLVGPDLGKAERRRGVLGHAHSVPHRPGPRKPFSHDYPRISP